MSIRTENYKFTTIQQLFNDMYLGIIKQGGAAASGGACMMRATMPDGSVRACAVGQLLRDDVVTTLYGEGASPHSYSTYFDACGIGANEAAYEVMRMAQAAHDNAAIERGKPVPDSAFLKAFKANMAELAKSLGLTLPKPLNPKTKRYAANVLRRAAKLLEENQAKHVHGYGDPWAEGDRQCFCAVAAVDVVLDGDGITPESILGEGVKAAATWLEGDFSTHTLYGGARPLGSFETKYAFGFNPLARELAGDECGGKHLWTFNDAQPRAKGGLTPSGFTPMTPEGTANVARAMRRIAARLEHGGKLKSPKKGGGSNV